MGQTKSMRTLMEESRRKERKKREQEQQQKQNIFAKCWDFFAKGLKKQVMHLFNPTTKLGLAIVTAITSAGVTKGVDLLWRDKKPAPIVHRHEQSNTGNAENTQNKRLQLLLTMQSLMNSNSALMDNTDILVCPECANVMTIPKNQQVTVNCNKDGKTYQNILSLIKDVDRS